MIYIYKFIQFNNIICIRKSRASELELKYLKIKMLLTYDNADFFSVYVINSLRFKACNIIFDN